MALFEANEGDLDRMAAELFGPGASRRKVHLRMNQLGLRLRTLRGTRDPPRRAAGRGRGPAGARAAARGKGAEAAASLEKRSPRAEECRARERSRLRLRAPRPRSRRRAALPAAAGSRPRAGTPTRTWPSCSPSRRIAGRAPTNVGLPRPGARARSRGRGADEAVLAHRRLRALGGPDRRGAGAHRRAAAQKLSPEEDRRAGELLDAVAQEERAPRGRGLARAAAHRCAAAGARAGRARAAGSGRVAAADRLVARSLRRARRAGCGRAPSMRWARGRGGAGPRVLTQLSPSHAPALRRLGEILALQGGLLEADRADERCGRR